MAADTDTQYRIGSITKTFVAVCVMRLRDAGRLDLDDRFEDPRVETRETFGKWDAGLAAAIGGARDIVLAGTSTDCCVLSTALAAADAGIRVQVVTDACAAPTKSDHERAIITMGMYAPLITMTSVAAVLRALD